MQCPDSTQTSCKITTGGAQFNTWTSYNKVQGFPLTPATGGPEAARSVEDPELPVNSPVPNVESCFSNIDSVE